MFRMQELLPAWALKLISAGNSKPDLLRPSMRGDDLHDRVLNGRAARLDRGGFEGFRR